MSTVKPGYMRPLDKQQGRVDLTHGAGGRATYQLIQEVFQPAFAPTWGALGEAGMTSGDDGVILPPLSTLPGVPADHRLVLSTDGHVVAPLFFPGGDIGRLAVHGTVNDLAMMGATPLYLTLSFILEEGLHLSDLVRVAESIGRAACEADVAIVAGDTKVVERGKGDHLYLSTAGVGWVASGLTLSGRLAQPGDVIVLSGSIGEHGLAVLSQRQGLHFEAPILSDTAPLHGLTQAMLASGARLRTLRDPTRGGVATSLNEIALASGVGMLLDEAAIPVQPAVHAACEFLGLDPLYLTNEGKLLAICHPDDAEALLAAMRAHPQGAQACRIGTVTEDPGRHVQMRTAFGGCRMLDWLMGDPLPRIC